MRKDSPMDNQIVQLEALHSAAASKLEATKIMKWTTLTKLIKTRLEKNHNEQALNNAYTLLFDLAIEIVESKNGHE